MQNELKGKMLDAIKNIDGLPSSIHDKLIDFLFSNENVTVEKTVSFIEKINNNKVDFHKFKELKKAILNCEIKKEINIKLSRVKNSRYGNPSFLVIDYDNEKLMENLIKAKMFKKYKKGLCTLNNSAFAYIIYNNAKIELKNYTINIKIV